MWEREGGSFDYWLTMFLLVLSEQFASLGITPTRGKEQAEQLLKRTVGEDNGESTLSGLPWLSRSLISWNSN